MVERCHGWQSRTPQIVETLGQTTIPAALLQIGQLLPLLIHRKAAIGFRLVYLHVTFAPYKCHGQSYSQLDCEICDKTESCGIAPYVSVYAALSCFWFCSFSAKATGYTGSHVEARNGSHFSVSVILLFWHSNFAPFLEIFHVKKFKISLSLTCWAVKMCDGTTHWWTT